MTPNGNEDKYQAHNHNCHEMWIWIMDLLYESPQSYPLDHGIFYELVKKIIY